MRSGGNHGRGMERVRALATALAVCIGELPTPADNSPVVLEESRALSTREAARLLGVTVYTVNEWARCGRLRCRQDSPGGRRYFDPANIAAYKAEHTSGGLPDPLAAAYSPGDATTPTPRAPAEARVDASGPRGGTSSHPQHRRPVGARRAPRKPARALRPYSPGSGAWSKPPGSPEG